MAVPVQRPFESRLSSETLVYPWDCRSFRTCSAFAATDSFAEWVETLCAAFECEDAGSPAIAWAENVVANTAMREMVLFKLMYLELRSSMFVYVRSQWSNSLLPNVRTWGKRPTTTNHDLVEIL